MVACRVIAKYRRISSCLKSNALVLPHCPPLSNQRANLGLGELAVAAIAVKREACLPVDGAAQRHRVTEHSCGHSHG